MASDAKPNGCFAAAGASLREGFAFRSGRLAAPADNRKLTGSGQHCFMLLKEGKNASLPALNKPFAEPLTATPLLKQQG
jgi:hypothetical protein